MTSLSPQRLLAFLRRITAVDRIAIAFLLLYGILRPLFFQGSASRYAILLDVLSLAALFYLCVRLYLWFRARLLWSLRNRLIVAYIFIAVVPVILLLGMMGIGLYLLYPQIGAHLLLDALQDRVDIIAADTDEILSAVLRELQPGESPTDQSLLTRPRVASLVDGAKAEWPGLRIFLQHQPRLSNSGNFRGLIEFRGELVFAAEERRNTPNGPVAVLVNAPVTPALLNGMASELGPIQFTVLEPAGPNAKGLILGAHGKHWVPGQTIVSSSRTLPPPANWLDIRVNGAATLEAYPVDADTTKYPATLPTAAPVLATFSLRPSALNRSLFSSVGAIGPILLELVVIAGVVFLIMEIAALATGVVLTRTITRSIDDLYEATQYVGKGDFTHRV